MGFLEDLLGGSDREAQIRRELDFDMMAAQRMAHGFEPIDWETILRSQLGYSPNYPTQPRRVKHVESRVIESKQITGEKAK